jgi:hypothetical protein
VPLNGSNGSTQVDQMGSIHMVINLTASKFPFAFSMGWPARRDRITASPNLNINPVRIFRSLPINFPDISSVYFMFFAKNISNFVVQFLLYGYTNIRSKVLFQTLITC